MMHFSPAFNKALLNIMIKELPYRKSIDFIPQEFFDDDGSALLWFKRIKKFIKKYGFINSSSFIQEYGDEASKLLSYKYADIEDYVKKNTRKFIYLSNLKKVIGEAADDFEKDFRDIDEIQLKKKVESLRLSWLEEKDSGGLDYYNNVEQRLMENNHDRGVPTGLDQIDEKLAGGGLNRGELGVIVSLPSRGKSGTLVNFAAIAAAHSYKVLYVTLELSPKRIARRMDMRLSGLGSREIPFNLSYTADRIKKFRRATGSSIYIQGFSESTCSPDDLDLFLQEMKQQGRIFDIVIVDYADIMAPNMVKKRDDLTIKGIYEDLRKLSNKWGVALWSASQVNRTGFTGLLDMDTLSDAFSKSFVADVMITINQNHIQYRNNVAYYYLIKNRNDSVRQFGAFFRTDWNRMLVTDFQSYQLYYGGTPPVEEALRLDFGNRQEGSNRRRA